MPSLRLAQCQHAHTSLPSLAPAEITASLGRSQPGPTSRCSLVLTASGTHPQHPARSGWVRRTTQVKFGCCLISGYGDCWRCSPWVAGSSSSIAAKRPLAWETCYSKGKQPKIHLRRSKSRNIMQPCSSLCGIGGLGGIATSDTSSNSTINPLSRSAPLLLTFETH